MEAATHLLKKAERCRRLASEIVNHGDPAVSKLLALAQELERAAAAYLGKKADEED